MFAMNRKATTNNHSVIRSFGYSVIHFNQGFTLIEMLVVIAIIATLIAATVGGYSRMTRTADRANAQELVNNVATALTALYQREGNWPKRLATEGGSDGELNESAALPLARGKYVSLTTSGSGTSLKLAGADRFGIITPWAMAVVKRRGTSATLSDHVGTMTVKDHLLHYALDLDGDGIIKGASVGGVSVNIRATAAVWCGGKDGVIDPYPYAGGGSGSAGQNANKKAGGPSDDVYSWAPGQTKEVQ